MRCATSLPKMIGGWPGASSSSASCACCLITSQTWRWNGRYFSKAKRRSEPGAMLQAICAASMAIVPLPQQGS